MDGEVEGKCGNMTEKYLRVMEEIMNSREAYACVSRIREHDACDTIHLKQE